jgi:L-aspartate oxidase
VQADLAVVGAGAAGLLAASTAAREGARVVLVSRSPLAETASYWAQGGIAAALAADDSPELHQADTLAAGRRTGSAEAARVLCEESPGRVGELIELGVRFDSDRSGALALGLEGGHSRRRVVHAGGSSTGRRVTRELSALVATDERIEVIEPFAAGALWCHEGRCVGLVAVGRDGGAREVTARGVVLATGGAAALWSRTTNPPGAAGSGLSLALSAGAALADLEFTQFHPTALVTHGRREGFLVTEAIRGEGALLLDASGERFVDELAPRDQVALAVQQKMREQGTDSVGLDVGSVDLARFPNVAAALDDVGLDPRRPLPVAPAAHDTMGGVAADLHGRSTLPGLFAVGESSCTGLHGANRLASNSLAECFVFGRRAALAALDEPVPPAERSAPPQAAAPELPSRKTREALWRLAGLERDAGGLHELLDDPYPLARSVAAACLAREESRGAHQRRDHPDTDAALDGMHAVVTRDGGAKFKRWT